MTRRYAACAGVALTFSQSATGALIVDAGPTAFTQGFIGGDYVAGIEFEISAPLFVDGLGYFDLGADGLVEQRRVGLWDADQNLLEEVLVTNASTALVSTSSLGQWLVTQMTPVVLGPGTYRIAGEVGSATAGVSTGAPSGDRTSATVTLSPGYVRSAFPDGGFAFPDQSFGSQALHVTLTSGQFAPIPLPATALLLGSGLAAAASVRRRG